MKPAELKSLTRDELNIKVDDLKKELFNLRFQNATGEIQNPKRIRTVRKDLARVLSIISEKSRV